MASNPSSRFRIPFGAYLAGGVLLAFGLQAALYLLMIENTIGPFYLFRNPKPSHPAMSGDFRIALLRSEATARMNSTRPDYYLDIERQWETVFRDARIPYRVISDRELAEGIASHFSAVVLPRIDCLGDNQRKAIGNAVGAGMGMVASGALGSRDGNCEWRGWDYLNEMTGLRSPYTSSSSAPINAAFRGQRYFSTGLPAGLNMEVSSQEFVAGEADQPDVFWADRKLRPAKGSTPSTAALAVHITRGQGRVVWFGFSETLPKAEASVRKVLDNYLVSSVRWAGRQPIAVVGDWPNRSRAAVFIAEDVIDPESALATSDLLQRERVPGTFFCSSAARGKPGLLKRLDRMGELASSGDSTEPFGDQHAAMQTERLIRAKRELESEDASIKVIGFNPPQGSSNDVTPLSLRNAGYQYYLYASEVRSAVPEITESGGGTALLPARKEELARIYVTASDDFEVIANYRGPTPWGDDLAEDFLKDFRRVEYLGGVYPLIFRTDLLGARENLHILRKIVQTLKAEPVWLTTGERLVQWWSEREKLSVEVRRIGNHRLRLAITNRGQENVQDASVYVSLPYHPRIISVSSPALSLKLPHSELTGDDDVLRLDLPPVRRQSSQVLLIALDE